MNLTNASPLRKNSKSPRRLNQINEVFSTAGQATMSVPNVSMMAHETITLSVASPRKQEGDVDQIKILEAKNLELRREKMASDEKLGVLNRKIS